MIGSKWKLLGCLGIFFFHYFIVINIIMVDVFHDVIKKQKMWQNYLCTGDQSWDNISYEIG